VWFPAIDGVMLEAWWIPCPGAKRVLLCNHPMTFNKGGFPGTQPGYDAFGAIDVNFIPDYEHLHKAGYAILAYDQRNHGRSYSNWGGFTTVGAHESRDVAGAMRFLASWGNTRDMEIGLYLRCMGANSGLAAFRKYPKDMAPAHALVALQPVSADAFVAKAAEGQGLDVAKALDLFDKGVWAEAGMRAADFRPQTSAPHVKIPTLVAQVRDDVFVDAKKDTQEIFDAIGTQEKKLHWITGTTRRFDGYNYFGKTPDELLGWFAKYFPAK
jgi:pimeloyl-ACP methyl ester carboxylesterase